ncbi:MAG: hypothetical protein IPN19_11370 [Elusimicrobia bacterium]|nr:hypothetical protein [Elusimicrobiota bacterium]
MSVTVFQSPDLDAQINSFGGGNGTANINSITENLKLLFFFDLSSIDSSDICSSAVLTLTNHIENHAILIDAYSIKSGNSGWNESVTDTTIDGTTAWAGSNWCNTAGTDYDTPAIGSETAVSGWFSTSSWNLNPNIVRTWFGVINSNYGFFLTTSSLQSNFYYMREESTASFRPKLTITHSDGTVKNRRSFAPLGTRAGARSEH